MEQEVSLVGGADDGGFAVMAPFVEWARMQGPEVFAQVMEHALLIGAVLHNDLMAEGPGLRCPNFWAMEQEAAALRDLAQSAGFVEAARYCEGTRQEAARMIAFVEECFGLVG